MDRVYEIEMITSNNDAELVTTISKLLSEQEALGNDERRVEERRQFGCVQLLAPYDGDTLPSQADFRQVQCRDVSPTGFSFLTYRQPNTNHVVVALGAVPFKFFAAEIAHVSLAETESTQNFLVGCKFVQRLGS